MFYQVEKVSRVAKVKRNWIGMFSGLQVGESFLVPPEDGKALRATATYFNGTRSSTRRLTVNKEPNGFRCSRIR